MNTTSHKLRAVADAIEFEPCMYDQRVYGEDRFSDHEGFIVKLGTDFPHAGTGECGTPCCIAGWAITLFGDPDDTYKTEQQEMASVDTYAAKILGLPFPNHWASHPLFVGVWPRKWFDPERRINPPGELPTFGSSVNEYYDTPGAEQAVMVLRKIANELEEENGSLG